MNVPLLWVGLFQGDAPKALKVDFHQQLFKTNPMDLKTRLMKHTIKTKKCWLWQASKIKGYGRIKVDGRLMLSHRLSYQLHIGPIPIGSLVCHHCDNPACIRPDHLFLGTKKDNAVDMVKKNRHGMGKISNDQAKEIRNLFDSGKSRLNIAQSFNLSYSHVTSIINNTKRPIISST